MAQFKPVPTGFKALTPEQIEQSKSSASPQPWMLRQEPGARPSCPLPYELAADGAMNDKTFEITFSAKTSKFGAKSHPGHSQRLRAKRAQDEGERQFV